MSASAADSGTHCRAQLFISRPAPGAQHRPAPRVSTYVAAAAVQISVIMATAFAPLRYSAFRYRHSPHVSTVLKSSFSSSAPRRMSAYDIAVTPPTLFLDALHTVGLPWWAALPAAACAVRVFPYTFLAKPMRQSAVTMQHLAPLLHARVINRLRRDAVRLKQPTILMLQLDKFKKDFQERRHLTKTFGLRSRLMTTLADFGMLIWMAEAVRRKCGSPEGLLRTVLYPMEVISNILTTKISDRLDAKTLTPGAETPTDAVPALVQGADIASVDPYPVAELNPIDSSLFDPSLMQEGILWNVDLTVPDDMITFLVLAFMCARTVWTLPALNAEAKAETSAKMTAPIRMSDLDRVRENRTERLKHMLTGWSLAFAFNIFVIMHLPGAVSLYLLSSMTASLAQRKVLESKIIMRNPIRPCKRPLAQDRKRSQIADD